MITPSTIYWLTRLDALNIVCVATLVISAFICVIAAIMFFGVATPDHEEDDPLMKSLLKATKTSFAIAIISTIVAAFLPTTKEMAAIIVVPRVANSETVQQLGDGIVNLAQEWMKELAPKKGETR